MTIRRRTLRQLPAAPLHLMAGSRALAQAWPARPIKVIVARPGDALKF